VADRTEGQAPERSLEQRLSDHVAIDRLADDLLPALAAKLSASGLGELEVREGSWKVRLRRPAGEAGASGPGGHPMRRASDRVGRPQPGHAEHGHPPGAIERTARLGGPAPDPATGASHGATTRPDGDEGPVARTVPGDTHRLIAASPAVGVYRPRPDLRPGTQVRAGDRLGVVDVLGVQQEVLSPADGLVGARLAEADQPVEYGQELLIVELLDADGTTAAQRAAAAAGGAPAAGGATPGEAAPAGAAPVETDTLGAPREDAPPAPAAPRDEAPPAPAAPRDEAPPPPAEGAV